MFSPFAERDTLGCSAKEDRRCAKGAMGKGEGGEEDGIAGWRDTVNERTKTEASRTTLPLIGVLRGILEEYRGGKEAGRLIDMDLQKLGRRGGRVAECGGLLSLRNRLLSC
jgi:hypothetical protein